ncbi:hypothetical protein LCGC14_1802200 [marine sediment metagenome]|uniref:Short-chain dehydrogenase/reductase SDR n=1 Tax=marine sediment metagenome TaxID=412755 RepID=A0A0F9J3X2_9ZZZZ
MTKTLFLTGASSGIGAATARAAAKAGWNIGLFARSEDKLKDLATELGEQALVLVGDATDYDAQKAALDTLLEDAQDVFDKAGLEAKTIDELNERGLDMGGAVITSAAIAVHRRGDDLGPHRHGKPGAMHPAEKPGVRIAGGLWHDGFGQPVEHGLRALPPRHVAKGGRLGKIGGNGLPGGVARMAHPVETPLEHLVHLRAECVPIGGIQSVTLIVHPLAFRLHRPGTRARGTGAPTVAPRAA